MQSFTTALLHITCILEGAILSPVLYASLRLKNDKDGSVRRSPTFFFLRVFVTFAGAYTAVLANDVNPFFALGIVLIPYAVLKSENFIQQI